MMQETFEASTLGLLRHALMQDDQVARTGVEQYLRKIVLAWLHCHPSREIACRWESEEHYVTLAFERFWQTVGQRKVTCETLAEVLVCLRASLHGAILEMLRALSRPRAAMIALPETSGERYVEDRTNSLKLWEILQGVLSSEREQRLAYLLYHCGLGPGEIVRLCPQEWDDVQEIYRLRRSIIEQLLNNTNLLHS